MTETAAATHAEISKATGRTIQRHEANIRRDIAIALSDLNFSGAATVDTAAGELVRVDRIHSAIANLARLAAQATALNDLVEVDQLVSPDRYRKA